MTFTDRDWLHILQSLNDRAQAAHKAKLPTERFYYALLRKARERRQDDRLERTAATILGTIVFEFPGIINDTETNGADVIARISQLLYKNPDFKDTISHLAVDDESEG